MGHFACVVGRVRGPGGSLYASPTPTPRSATAACTCSRRSAWRAALERGDMPAGGMLVVVSSAATPPAVRAGAAGLGLREGDLGQRHA